MICSPVSEIAFSQVREDPLIELRVLQRIAKKRGDQLRVLLVASGGCTALSLLASPLVVRVDAVDLNPAQLHLVELRRQALLHLPLRQQLQVLGAEPVSETARLALYERVRSHLPAASRNFWDARPEQIAFGLNRVGRFEQLFRELSAQFAALQLDPLQDPQAVISYPQWQTIFETVFERDKLAATFGEAAVNYSMDRSFGEHFADVFAQALQRFDPTENYFLTQVWGDRYNYAVDGVPLYLQPQAQESIRALGRDRLHLHLGAFAQQMVELASTDKFDLIQFSNISDWMPLPDLHQMLATAVQCLNPGGALIGRRLNGDHHLAAVMAEHLAVDEIWSSKLLAMDRSFFYREVVVGQCS